MTSKWLRRAAALWWVARYWPGCWLSHGVLNPAVALATSPAVWATLLSAVAFSLVFSIIECTKPAQVEDSSASAPKAQAISLR